MRARVFSAAAIVATVTSAGCAGLVSSQNLPAGRFEPSFRHKTGVVEKLLYSFKPGQPGSSKADGANPIGALVALNGTLYGTTFHGGTYNAKPGSDGFGAVYSMTTSGGEKILYRFQGDQGSGQYPAAGLAAVNGMMYGTTKAGGKTFGTVFSVAPNGKEAVLYRFLGTDGAKPQGRLTNVNGKLYGTTSAGGKYGNGTVFSITQSGVEAVLHSFGGTSGEDGTAPQAGLVNVSGKLYGTTTLGGAHDRGTVFEITPSGTETVLYSFAGGTGDGSEPLSGVINLNGTLYGTTSRGGTSNFGTVFAVTTSGKETIVHSFIARGDGAYPQAGLINVSGTLYGTTYAGGANSFGAVYSITPSGAENIIYSFGGFSGDGSNPYGEVIDVKGALYGTTFLGGANMVGTVYSLTGI
jgi:uncharacterized repeat protein (TIGR03803 family)